jgi:ectoine hydroxylase-related dioxygenase (phytanoyl-CoA dioxygenase family)
MKTSAASSLTGKILGKLRNELLWLCYLPYYSWPIWFNVINKRARAHYRAHALPLDLLQQRAVQELKEQGICVLDCAELFSTQALADYLAFAERVLQEPRNQQRITTARSQMGTATVRQGKYYEVRLWDDEPVLDLHNPFVQFSLSDEIMGIVCGYLEMSARLGSVQLPYNLAMLGRPKIASQTWHRDPNDRKMVQVYFYLRDVDETTGPFEFIPGSHETGPFGKIFPRKLPAGVYPPADAVERKFSHAQRRICTGKAGTIVICDSSGIHRGGHAVSRDRYVLNTYYATDGGHSVKKQRCRLEPHDRGALSRVAEYAIETEVVSSRSV